MPALKPNRPSPNAAPPLSSPALSLSAQAPRFDNLEETFPVRERLHRRLGANPGSKPIHSSDAEPKRPHHDSEQMTPLNELVENALNRYFADLDGESTGDLYALVMNEVERPLLSKVLAHCNGNQSRAAELLGINRGTLRKKLKQHEIG